MTRSVTNADPAELAKFNRLAARWWGEPGLSRDALKRIPRRRAGGHGCPPWRHAPGTARSEVQ